jgi:hypothetical protein
VNSPGTLGNLLPDMIKGKQVSSDVIFYILNIPLTQITFKNVDSPEVLCQKRKVNW